MLFLLKINVCVVTLKFGRSRNPIISNIIVGHLGSAIQDYSDNAVLVVLVKRVVINHYHFTSIQLGHSYLAGSLHLWVIIEALRADT